MPELLKGADVAREEALSMSADSRVPDPSHVDPNRQAMVKWQKWYQLLWKLKLADVSKNHR